MGLQCQRAAADKLQGVSFQNRDVVLVVESVRILVRFGLE